MAAALVAFVIVFKRKHPETKFCHLKAVANFLGWGEFQLVSGSPRGLKIWAPPRLLQLA